MEGPQFGAIRLELPLSLSFNVWKARNAVFGKDEWCILLKRQFWKRIPIRTETSSIKDFLVFSNHVMKDCYNTSLTTCLGALLKTKGMHARELAIYGTLELFSDERIFLTSNSLAIMWGYLLSALQKMTYSMMDLKLQFGHLGDKFLDLVGDKWWSLFKMASRRRMSPQDHSRIGLYAGQSDHLLGPRKKSGFFEKQESLSPNGVRVGEEVGNYWIIIGVDFQLAIIS
ncbi:hypothetical protein Tco_0185122 [Tanacetum coccineum]